MKYVTLAVTILPLLYSCAWAADGAALVKRHNCAACHAMKGPSAATVEAVLKRKAPDLFYAGNKFNSDWLAGWLQSPTAIRPAGTVYVNHVEIKDGKDTLIPPAGCPVKLGAQDAAAVAAYLMSLIDPKMKTGAFTPAPVKAGKARLILTRDEACDACHRLPEKGGGVSCPTLEGAGARLNPDWMYSFIRDPHYWDPTAWMPKKTYDEERLRIMVNYLVTLK